MGLFGRKRKKDNQSGSAPTASVSPALLRELEGFGRFTYDPQSNPLPGDLEFRMFQAAQANRSGFLGQMASAAAEHGGWVAYGAERLVVSVMGGDLPDPEYDVLMRASLGFLRANGVPNSRLSGYEWNWWLAHDGVTESWLQGQAAPELPAVRDLSRGEVRHIATMTSAPDSNQLYAQATDDDAGVTVMIDAARNDTDPTRSRGPWHRAATMHELFLQVGPSLQTPPHWADPELLPYIPLRRPTL